MLALGKKGGFDPQGGRDARVENRTADLSRPYKLLNRRHKWWQGKQNFTPLQYLLGLDLFNILW